MSGLRSEINVTPLVDVVLVLLIIFMVIAPLSLRGYDVDVPDEAQAPADRSAPRQAVLQIGPAGCPLIGPLETDGLPDDCVVRLDDEVLPVAALEHRVAELFGSRAPAERVLFLAADDELNYEGVMRIVDAAEAGAAGLRIGLVLPADLTPPP